MHASRNEIMNAYTVVDGIIQSPGEFEGEPVYAPRYWFLAGEGFADAWEGEDDCVSVFEIKDEERKE